MVLLKVLDKIYDFSVDFGPEFCFKYTKHIDLRAKFFEGGGGGQIQIFSVCPPPLKKNFAFLWCQIPPPSTYISDKTWILNWSFVRLCFCRILAVFQEPRMIDSRYFCESETKRKESKRHREAREFYVGTIFVFLDLIKLNFFAIFTQKLKFFIEKL